MATGSQITVIEQLLPIKTSFVVSIPKRKRVEITGTGSSSILSMEEISSVEGGSGGSGGCFDSVMAWL